MRSIGLDVGKHVAEVAIREPGRPTRSGGRISASPESLQAFAATLGPDDQVVLEATTNTWAIVELVDLTLRLLDGLAAEVELAEGGIARAVVDDARVRHLLTIPGVGLQTAVGLVALVGNIGRFARPNKLVGYGGEPSGTPSVEQRSISCMASRRTAPAAILR
jgi:transposase